MALGPDNPLLFGLPVHCRMLSCISGLYPPHASDPHTPKLSGGNQKHLQTLRNVPWGPDSPLAENHRFIILQPTNVTSPHDELSISECTVLPRLYLVRHTPHSARPAELQLISRVHSEVWVRQVQLSSACPLLSVTAPYRTAPHLLLLLNQEVRGHY